MTGAADMQDLACRALALRLTARLLEYPDEGVLSCLDSLAELFEADAPEEALLSEMRETLGTSAACVPGDARGLSDGGTVDSVVLLKLQTDYTALFIGAFEMLAVPYASYYLDGERQLGGPTMVAVERCYRRHGLVLEAKLKRPGDHLATMLEFVSALLEQALGKRGSERDALLDEACRFCRLYLSAWPADFASLAVSRAETGFYRVLGRFVALALSGGGLLPERSTGDASSVSA